MVTGFALIGAVIQQQLSLDVVVSSHSALAVSILLPRTRRGINLHRHFFTALGVGVDQLLFLFGAIKLPLAQRYKKHQSQTSRQRSEGMWAKFISINPYGHCLKAA